MKIENIKENIYKKKIKTLKERRAKTRRDVDMMNSCWKKRKKKRKKEG